MVTVTDEDRARVQEVVDEMARSVGLEPPCVRVRKTKGCARVREEPRGRVAVEADPKLARAPLGVLRKMLAHELHVWCGHATRQRCISTGGVLYADRILPRNDYWLRLDRPPDLVPDLVILALALCMLVMGMTAWTAPSCAHEWEADRAAVDLFGIGLDDELADWMQTNGFGDTWAPEVMHTHPKLRERARATATYQQQVRRQTRHSLSHGHLVGDSTGPARRCEEGRRARTAGARKPPPLRRLRTWRIP